MADVSMTLAELLIAAGGTAAEEPPCPIWTGSLTVRVVDTPPEAEMTFFGYFTGAFPVGPDVPEPREKAVGAHVLALRTGGPQDPEPSMRTPVTVLIVQLGVNFDAWEWNTGSVSEGLLTIPTVQVLFTQRRLDAGQVEIINDRIEAVGIDGLPELPEPQEGTTLDKWMASVVFTMGGTELPLQVGWQRASYDVTPLPDDPGDVTTADVSVTAGTLRVSGFSIGFAECALQVTVAAELTVAGMSLALSGLGFWVSMDGSMATGVTWTGAGLDYQTPPPPARKPSLTILLALAKVSHPGMATSLAGMGLLALRDFLTMVVSAYYGESEDGWVSVFGYGEISIASRMSPLGVPPAVVINGFSLGLGMNSTVRVPNAADIGDFPLVRQLGNPGSALSALQALDSLAGPGGWLTPAQGQFWFAGGMQISLIGGFVTTNAMMIFEMTSEKDGTIKLMLIASSTLSFPKTRRAGAEPICKVILDLVIATQFLRDTTIFTMEVALGAGSYILDKRLQPTGGISLYIRTKTLAFAFSVGGYHPQYLPPARDPDYPVPPRVGLVGKLAGLVTLRFESYFSVTPNAFMVGFSGQLMFAAGGACSIQLWMMAYFEILIQWNPFYLDTEAGFGVGFAVTIGIGRVRLRMSVEVGAIVGFWMPPFGGRFGIKLWFITLKVRFGAERKGPPPVPWDEFSLMLPTPVSVQPEDGVQPPDYKANPESRIVPRSGSAANPLLASSEGFSAVTNAAMSANRVTLNGAVVAETSQLAAIRPMQLRRVDSTHQVTLLRNGLPYDPRSEADPGRHWLIEAVWDEVPVALWGQPVSNMNKELNAPETIPDRIAGLRFTIPEPAYGPELGAVSAAALAVSPVLPEGLTPLRDPRVAGPGADIDPLSVGKIAGTILTNAAARTELYAELSAAGIAMTPESDQRLTEYHRKINSMYTTAPLLTRAAR